MTHWMTEVLAPEREKAPPDGCRCGAGWLKLHGWCAWRRGYCRCSLGALEVGPIERWVLEIDLAGE